jgi:hypothetical protein
MPMVWTFGKITYSFHKRYKRLNNCDRTNLWTGEISQLCQTDVTMSVVTILKIQAFLNILEIILTLYRHLQLLRLIRDNSSWSSWAIQLIYLNFNQLSEYAGSQISFEWFYRTACYLWIAGFVNSKQRISEGDWNI